MSDDPASWALSSSLLPGIPTIQSYANTTSTGPPVYPRIEEGRPFALLDIGSVGNLVGEKTAKNVARIALQHGRTPHQEARAKPLNVSGVGNGSQRCIFDCKLPVALGNKEEAVGASITTPVVPGSELPLLLGLTAMENNRTVLDLVNGNMWICGPGDLDLEKAMPPGSRKISIMKASGGHLVLPIDDFAYLDNRQTVMPERELVLPAKASTTSPSRL